MFKKAERKKSFLKMALTGISGSGKTYSSLLIARGLVGESEKIAVIDTENGSASLYSDLTNFDVAEMHAPFTVEKYTQAILEAEKDGYSCIVIDSMTHAWQNILLEKEQMDSRGGNTYTNWSKMTPKHQAFINAIMQSKIHVIGTMRVKQDYALETNQNGKVVPKKIGLAPIQRDGMEYEFTIVFDVSQDHSVIANKDRTGLFDGKIFKPTIDTGIEIRNWLSEGKKEEVKKEDVVIVTTNDEKLGSKTTTNDNVSITKMLATEAQKRAVWSISKNLGNTITGKLLDEMTMEEASAYIKANGAKK